MSAANVRFSPSQSANPQNDSQTDFKVEKLFTLSMEIICVTEEKKPFCSTFIPENLPAPWKPVGRRLRSFSRGNQPNTWSHEPVQVLHLWKAAPASRQNEDQTNLEYKKETLCCSSCCFREEGGEAPDWDPSSRRLRSN